MIQTNSQKKKRLYIIIALLGTTVGIGVAILGWEIWNMAQPKLPIYPRSQEVSIRDKAEIADRQGRPAATAYVVSFWTPDTPEAVIAFYREALAQEGWVFERVDMTPGRQGFLVFHRQQGGMNTVMGLTVSAASSERPQLIHVELTLADYDIMQQFHMLGGSFHRRPA